LANRPTAPIVGANSIEQLQDSLTAAGFRLSDEEMDALNELSDWEKA
jgi:aryl-alcohol dehydrogenase-like predicted oxidoreductase